MTDDAPQSPPQIPPPETQKIAAEDLARMLAASAMMPTPGPVPGELPGAGALRRKLLVAILIAAIGVGASVMSCVGQSFSYRQARALEGIEQQLKEIRASCPATAPAALPREGPR